MIPHFCGVELLALVGVVAAGRYVAGNLIALWHHYARLRRLRKSAGIPPKTDASDLC